MNPIYRFTSLVSFLPVLILELMEKSSDHSKIHTLNTSLNSFCFASCPLSRAFSDILSIFLPGVDSSEDSSQASTFDRKVMGGIEPTETTSLSSSTLIFYYASPALVYGARLCLCIFSFLLFIDVSPDFPFPTTSGSALNGIEGTQFVNQIPPLLRLLICWISFETPPLHHPLLLPPFVPQFPLICRPSPKCGIIDLPMCLLFWSAYLRPLTIDSHTL